MSEEAVVDSEAFVEKNENNGDGNVDYRRSRSKVGPGEGGKTTCSSTDEELSGRKTQYLRETLSTVPLSTRSPDEGQGANNPYESP